MEYGHFIEKINIWHGRMFQSTCAFFSQQNKIIIRSQKKKTSGNEEEITTRWAVGGTIWAYKIFGMANEYFFIVQVIV